MKVKVIAIGNRIMGDDGVAIKAAEWLFDRLKNQGVEVIIGETDISFTYNMLTEGDMFFIMDAMHSGEELGTVKILPLEKIQFGLQEQYSQHQLSLLHLLQLCTFSLTGYFIGIEVRDVNFSTRLSNELEEKFERICEDIAEHIFSTLRVFEDGINSIREI